MYKGNVGILGEYKGNVGILGEMLSIFFQNLCFFFFAITHPN